MHVDVSVVIPTYNGAPFIREAQKLDELGARIIYRAEGATKVARDCARGQV